MRQLLDDEHPFVRRVAIETIVALEDREAMLGQLRRLKLEELHDIELIVMMARRLESMESR